MIEAATCAEAGFYFEEGGCWAMALALQDCFCALGVDAQLALQTNGACHAMVCVGKKLFDHQGEILNPVSYKIVSENELFNAAYELPTTKQKSCCSGGFAGHRH